jgi:hypothetical protein
MKQLVLKLICNILGPTGNLHQTGFNYVNSIICSGVIGISFSNISRMKNFNSILKFHNLFLIIEQVFEL